MQFHALGKFLILCGGLLVVFGAVLILINKAPFIGRLPGDICIQKKNFTLYFPITTSIIVSIVLSALFWLWTRR